MLSPPGTAGMVLQPTHQLLEEYLQRTLLPSFKKIIVHHDIGRRVIHLPGQRLLYYRSGHVPERIQMSDLTYLLLDEPHLMVRKAFENAVARAREADTRLRILLTTLPKIGWLSEEFEGRDDSERRAMHVRTYDNRFATEQYIRNLRSFCPAHMHACYLEGQFVASGGSVYAMYDEKRHVIPWQFGRYVQMEDGSHSRPVMNYVFDWSPRRPHVLWMQRVPKGARMPGGWVTKREVSICVDEIYPDGKYTPVHVRRLCRIAKARKSPDAMIGAWPAEEAVCDPAGKAVQATSGESEIIQAQEELGVPVNYLYGQRVKVGVSHVQLALDPLDGHPYLFFAESLKHNPDPVCGYGSAQQNKLRSVLKAMPGYSYSETQDGKAPDEPYHDDTFSHAADDVRYHCRFYHPVDRLTAEVWTVT